MKIVGATGLAGLWTWHICEKKRALRTRHGIFNLKSQFSIFGSFRDIRVHICDIFVVLWASEWTWQTFFGSIDRYWGSETLPSACYILTSFCLFHTFRRIYFHLTVTYFPTNLVYPMGSETLPSGCYILSDESSIPYILYRSERLPSACVTYFPTNLVYPLPVTYFSTNLVYPFPLRVTGITTMC